jgi:hypothetical protein
MKKETGTLLINNNNGLVCHLLFNGQKYRLKNYLLLFKGNKLSLNKATVDFEIVRGKITKIIHNNIEIYNIPLAKAPYNFITLNENETLINNDFIRSNKYFLQEDDYYNGYIDIEAHSKTSVYVRGTLPEGLKENSFFTNQKGDKVRIENYCPAGNLGIPGSSIRGMIRNLVEIVSFGKFGFINDDILYFRSFADDCLNLRYEYNDFLGSTSQDIKVGLIYKEGRRYKLIPNGTEQQVPHTYSEKQYFDRISSGHYLIHSGDINGKMYDMEIYCKEEKSKAINIPDSDIQSYVNDTNRGNGVINIIKEANNNDFVPCFYFDGEDGHITFGHTRFFRVPYLNSISNCIYEELTDQTNTDLVNVMFGDTSHAGKLFFEDLKMIKGYEDAQSVPKILASPKPTSIQLYLEQGDKDIVALNHYNSENSLIRGNKQYWHKSNDFHWRESGDQTQLIDHIKNGDDKQRTIIKPIKKGATFAGRIRFENLTSVELGSLFFVLRLKEGWCHKIGMAKPLGLGTIKILPSLHLSDRAARYKSLNSEWGEIGAIVEESQLNYFIEKFADAVWEVVDKKGKGKDLWKHPRLKQLAIMLNWENKTDDSLTDYMKLPEFKHRMVLPTPEEVIKQNP